MSDAKMAAKIQALLNLAEHPGTPENERLLASEKAAELMEKYAIDELMARGTAAQQSEEIISRRYRCTGTYFAQFSQRIHTLAAAVGMRSYYTKMQSGVIVTVVGFESDFPKFDALWTSQELQVIEAWKMYVKSAKDDGSWKWMSASERWTAKHSYHVGYGVGFATRVKAGRNQAVHDSTPGSALVLVDRSKRVSDHVDGSVKLKSGRGTRTGYGAFRDGQAAGNNARTGNSEVGGKGVIGS